MILTLSSAGALAQNQGQIVPSGSFTPGHTVRCLNSTCTVAGDAGGSAGSTVNGSKYLTELGITNTGTPLCINDALTNAAGGYHQWCAGASALGGGIISYGNFGGAAANPLNIYVNGQQIASGIASGLGLLGAPTAPTQTSSDSSTKIATTAFVTAAIGSFGVAPLPIVNNNAALQALSTLTTARVMRLGFAAAGDASPLVYIASNTPCSLNAGAGDGGSQVSSADGKCWVASLPAGAIDSRWWGVAYPWTLHISAGGNDSSGNNWCFNASLPCATIQHGQDIAAKLDFNHQNNNLAIDGTFSGVGASFTGRYSGTAGNGVSGQYLYVTGTNGSSAVTVTQIVGQVWNLQLSQGAGVVFSGMTISVPSAGYGIAAQHASTFVGLGNDLKFVGASGASNAIYGEADAIIERNASGVTTTVQGEFARAFTATTGALIELDPGGTSTFSAGSGLTVPAGGAFANAALGGKIQWNTASNSGTVTGEVARLFSGGIISITGGSATIPGNGVTRNVGGFLVDGSGVDLLAPSLGTCANAVLAGQDTNYAMQVNFTGANTSCAVLFGKLSGSSAAFAANPRCVGQVNDGGATKFVGIITVSTSGFTIIPSAAMANNQAIYIHCLPPSSG